MIEEFLLKCITYNSDEKEFLWNLLMMFKEQPSEIYKYRSPKDLHNIFNFTIEKSNRRIHIFSTYLEDSTDRYTFCLSQEGYSLLKQVAIKFSYAALDKIFRLTSRRALLLYLAIIRNSDLFYNDNGNLNLTLTLEEYKELLEIASNSYSRFIHLKEHRILPILDELNQNGIDIRYSYKKDRQKVVGIIFKVLNHEKPYKRSETYEECTANI